MNDIRLYIRSIITEPFATTQAMLETGLQIAMGGGDPNVTLTPERQEALDLIPGSPLRGDRSRAKVSGSTAIIPIIGALIPRATMFSALSGVTSVTDIASDLEVVRDTPSIKNAILYMDTPGGQVTLINEAAKLINEVAQVKNVVTYVFGSGASGGYWLATASRKIYMDDTASVGNIGVVATLPLSEGKEVTVITSSNAPNKRPDLTTDEGIDVLRQQLNDIEAVFISHVAAHRGVTEDVVKSTFGGGTSVVGQRAVAAGMADGIRTFAELFNEVENSMITKTTAAESVEDIRAAYPTQVAQIENEAKASVKVDHSAAVTAERERIQAIFEAGSAYPHMAEDMKVAMFDGATTAGDFALSAMQKGQSLQAKQIKEAADDLPDNSLDVSNPKTPATASDDIPTASTRAEAKEIAESMWDDKDARARNYFSTKESFVACVLAEGFESALAS